MPIQVCFGVRQPLPPFSHIADTHEGICYVSFGHLLPHTSPLSHLLPFRHVADTQKGICNISLSPHTKNMPVLVCLRLLDFPVSCPGRHENVTIWVTFSCWLHFLPIRTPTCPFGHVGGLRQVLYSQTRRNIPYGTFLHVQLHSLHIRTPPMSPNGYVSGVRCSAACLPPQTLPLSRHENTPIWGMFSCLLSTFSSHLQCAHLGMLVFGPPTHFSYSPLLPFFLPFLTVISILVISFLVIFPFQ